MSLKEKLAEDLKSSMKNKDNCTQKYSTTCPYCNIAG